MAKFKINDRVRIVATGEFGTVKGREVTATPTEEFPNKVKIEYIVKVGEGFANWKVYTKNELDVVREGEAQGRVYSKVYDVVDGYKITMYTRVESEWGLMRDVIDYSKERHLYMGYAIYSPADTYDENVGIRIARKRSRTCPFCHMASVFNGEFNAATVEALMDVKADYIKNNFDKFINRAKK